MNRLIHETSPYLLQHAHNPVDWYAWKPEAFERAKTEDKPIVVSIGYSTCHWCHVMERESFEDPKVADFMNRHFINIKVDREERPDVDQIYMEACQIISGSGGWPLNCFLTPDGRPFFAGTYYPPQPAYGRASWLQVLNNLAMAFKEKRQTVEEQADKLTGIIRQSDKQYIRTDQLTIVPSFAKRFWQAPDHPLHTIFYGLRERFDRVEGGFGGAPKFPGTMSIQFLLDYYFYTKNKEALDHALLSLDKMIQGGIYDQLGGGFARYATDREWLIPHFEKMLYDNALLIQVISEAYKLTQRDIYRETIEETLAFILRDMYFAADHTKGAFYSAYDADSEGVEGKFYVWAKSDIDAVLGKDADIFCQFYGVTEGGNWENHNILWREKTYNAFAEQHKLDVVELKNTLKAARQKLFDSREKRIKPGLDDKILLSWNALMVSAFAKAYEALGTEGYKAIAETTLDFILDKFKKDDAFGLFHTFKKETPQYDAFLEDYAFLIEALLDVFSITFDKKYLYLARDFNNYVLTHFWDESDGLFFFTNAIQNDIILRKKDLYDSATPSGNATMVKNLLRLSILLNDTHARQKAERMLAAVEGVIVRYPSSFSKWASCFMMLLQPPFEIAVVGKKAEYFAKGINALFLPNKIIVASVEADDTLPLLSGKIPDTTALITDNDTMIYVCENYTCQKPVKNLKDLQSIIDKQIQ